MCDRVCVPNVGRSRASHTESRKMSLLVMLSIHFTLFRFSLECVFEHHMFIILLLLLYCIGEYGNSGAIL